MDRFRSSLEQKINLCKHHFVEIYFTVRYQCVPSIHTRDKIPPAASFDENDNASGLQVSFVIRCFASVLVT